MTLIAQITDPHLRDDDTNPVHDPAQAMRAVFSAISKLDLAPEAIVLTGDIIDRSAKGYGHALPLLKEAPFRLFPMPGNHDRTDEFRAAFSDWVIFQPDHLSYTHQLNGVLLIALDSNLPNGKAGIDETRLNWLQSVLKSAQTPALLAMHHPPFPSFVPHLERGGFQNSDKLASLIKNTSVCRLITGHSHRAIQSVWAGVHASTALPIGHGLSLSLSGRTPHTPIHSPIGFDLHHFIDGHVISHQMHVAL